MNHVHKRVIALGDPVMSSPAAESCGDMNTHHITHTLPTKAVGEGEATAAITSAVRPAIRRLLMITARVALPTT
ncbi:hypothetical protein OG889_24665 [Streptomyces sp. NBC_00481]|uniref:hypothetical protein n=1 Tax=unclassified Streptomyces TaxID=2593676 RepID=UPI002DDB7DE7|nr:MULTISPECIES: hypothetical protein [unclassified Streptomyces]WRY97623.1 hypothetical protein OG889_24665 [Streptomyces sp. NBC_00481]